MGEQSGMEKPHRYPVIFNPNARSQKGGRVMRFIRKHADRLEFHPTRYAGEAREMAERFAAAGEPVVIAAGGDGTLNEVVTGLVGSKTILGVMPAGTMNVFAREMGISCDSLEQALLVIERGFVQEVDLFGANGSPFVQMAGVGFDALVIEETSWESKKFLGPLAYLLAAVKVLGEEPPKLEIVCPDGRREEGVAVLAGNGTLYGGPFRIFRNANNHDSKLDVIIYKESGYRLVLDSLRGLAFGGIDLTASTSYLQTSEFVVHSDREVPVQVDGEWIGRFREVRFLETPNRLRVLAPEDPFIGGFSDAVKSLLQWPRQTAELQTSRTG
jgi:YegS/Rv2252/BmrU family lipid kinase